MSKLHELAQLGQSIWYDNIRRALLDHGEMRSLIEQGVTGVTSNPTIFEKAIAGSADYDQALRQLVDKGQSVSQIYETLALEDIGRTADLLRPIYNQTDGRDGYVSLEVSPTLAHDTAGTVAEARRLFATLGRPNVMIKVPATPAGIPAIETLIGEGINVNVTLIFSVSQYEAVSNAYLSGLEKWVAAGGDPGRVASVASFFISRVDSTIDDALSSLITHHSSLELRGKIAIANAKVAYGRFRQLFSGERWERLAAKGARAQRPLWASTGTKNPLYPDTLYLDTLIGPDTVNTVPPATLAAFLDHGAVASTLADGLDAALTQLDRLADLGIDLAAVTQRLQDEGVASFAKSFESLMKSIADKQARLLAGRPRQVANVGRYQAAVDRALTEMRDQKIMGRIWAHDYTIWKPEPTEITNRLGWLHSPENMADSVTRLKAFVEEVTADGYTDALLLGMGGSSLAPEL
ncbi:MAG: transaldolase, partial [Chloroflexota bacterium]